MREEDIAYMKSAIELASKGVGKTSPNPCVGAVVVKNSRIIGKGYHRIAGGPHAEIYALRKAGKRAAGATLYVSLEPCRHYGKTPPCVDAIIRSGIKRVVVAMKDPNPLNNGRGLDLLKKAGIKTECGLLKNEASKINEPFIKYITQGIPYVTVKTAQTLDGKIASRTGDSRWISSEASRRIVHRMRSAADAIMVGANTVSIDDPLLTAREKGNGARQPVRVILSGKKAISRRAKVLNSRGGNVIIARPDARTGKVAMRALLAKLAGRGVTSVLIEGGGEVIASAFEEGVVDKVCFFIAPKIIGGRDAKTPVEGKGIAGISEAIKLKDMTCRKVGEDVLIEGYVRR
jgi:diaminohydroxyphosphoribosylaminopyrimidine deaminase/5-amino-6-(5-phosphoribosylamino)uracil reductase